MKGFFGMKSKKQQCKQKHSTLIQEPQFKRSTGNRSSLKHRVATTTTTIKLDESTINRTTTSPYETTPLSLWKRIFKNRELPKCTEQNLPPIASQSAITTNDDLNNQTDSIPSELRTLTSNRTQRFFIKPKLPPISSVSPSFSSESSNLSPSRYTPGLCGLKNIGNTCFMNSAIQCLNSIPDLTEWIMQQSPRLTDMNVLDVYISLVQSMWSGRQKCVTPSNLKKYVSHTAPRFSDYSQNDSHEFMNSLLNAIQTIDSNSCLINLFRIHIQSKTTCNKHQHVDSTEETTTFLSLPIPQTESYTHANILLEDLIKDFCQEDELSGEYYCQKCKICVSARHKTTIIQPLPHALIIQLKRFAFDGTNNKIDTHVQYKLEHQNLLSNNDRYKLSAISMHSGNLASGHYTTIAQNYNTKKWYRFDDSYVEEIDLKSILSPFIARQAYVLIYLKQND